MPALARRHPGDPLRLAGCPGHQRVVGVRDHPAVRGREGRPPAPREQPDLRRPVHLIPAQVQQHHDPRAGRLEHGRQVLLVDLQHRHGGVRRPGERRHQAGLHVRAERVGGYLLAERAERGGDQPGRGGLAVGAGDQDDLPTAGEQRKQIGLEPEADDPADDRSVAAPGEPGSPPGRTADRGGQARAERKPGPPGRRAASAHLGTHLGPDAIRSRPGAGLLRGRRDDPMWPRQYDFQPAGVGAAPADAHHPGRVT